MMSSSRTRSRRESGPGPSDLAIVLLGPIGAGKSTFVDKLCQEVPGVEVRSDSHDVSARLQEAILPASEVTTLHPGVSERRLILLDTPGLRNTYADDSKVLTKLADWLTPSANRRRIFVGVIYLFPICPFKMTAPERQNLELLPKLFGGAGVDNSRIFPVTSRWDRCKCESVGVAREDELCRNYWSPFLPEGARPHRFSNDGQSAREIIKHILNQHLEDKERERIPIQEVGTRRPSFIRGLLARQRRPIEARQRKIVLLMGETGVGKSSFLNDLAGDAPGQGRAIVNDNLQGNPTIDYYDIALDDSTGGEAAVVTFVDCPGYNNTDMRDRDINAMIRDFLDESPSLFAPESQVIGVVCLIDASSRFLHPAEWHSIFVSQRMTCAKILAVTHRQDEEHIQTGITSLKSIRVIKEMLSNRARIEPYTYGTRGYAQSVVQSMFLNPALGNQTVPAASIPLRTFLDKILPS